MDCNYRHAGTVFVWRVGDAPKYGTVVIQKITPIHCLSVSKWNSQKSIPQHNVYGFSLLKICTCSGAQKPASRVQWTGSGVRWIGYGRINQIQCTKNRLHTPKQYFPSSLADDAMITWWHDSWVEIDMSEEW